MPEWDEKEPVAILDNGYGIYRMVTKNDRVLHRQSCTSHCVDQNSWEHNFEQGLQLYTVRDTDGVARGVICACDAVRCAEVAAGTDYTPYARSRAGNLDHPVRFPNGEELVICELCPSDALWSNEDHEDVQPVKAWLHTLDKPEGLIGEWNPMDRESRTTAVNILKELKGEA